MRYISPELHEKKAIAGRIGGLQTFLRHGSEHMSAMAVKGGGRPRALTLDDVIRQSQSLKDTDKNEEGGMDTPRIQTNSLVTLKRLWRDRQRSTAGVS
jgi:hypothetical protein